MQDTYYEKVKLNYEEVTVFAAFSMIDEKPFWSIGVSAYDHEFAFKSMDKDALQKLHDLRDKIDGAIKYLHDKPKQNDVEKGKNDDVSAKSKTA